MMKRDSLGRYIKGSTNPTRGTGRTKNCLECGVLFSGRQHTRKYCSVACWDKHRSEALSKGWRSTKRIEYLKSGAFMEHQVKIVRHNEKHHAWKGDNAGYASVHSWIVRNAGKAKSCSFNSLHESTRFQWANISGTYRRDVDDYAQLCPSCHKTYDNIVKKHPGNVFVFNGEHYKERRSV